MLDSHVNLRYTLEMTEENLPHYSLTYRNKKGKRREHTISRPFDMIKNNEGSNIGFVSYSYGKGIRSFRYDRVIEMTPTKTSV
jgi:hypothetical protein